MRVHLFQKSTQKPIVYRNYLSYSIIVRRDELIFRRLIMSARCKTNNFGKNNSVCYDAKVFSTSNVNLLRNIFENNFKLSNPFKSKSKNEIQGMNTDENAYTETDEFNENEDTNTYNGSSKCKSRGGSTVSPLAEETGTYLACKIQNCCCKTFFRGYNEMSKFRYRHSSETSLGQCNSIQPTANFVYISHGVRPRTTHNSNARNKVYEINYEFCKSKPSTGPTSGGLTVDTEDFGMMVTEHTSSQIIIKNNSNETDVKEWTELLNIENDSSTGEILGLQKESNSNFKCRVYRAMATGARENSYPYAIKNSRLTVKCVRNKNLSNVKRREKSETNSLRRSNTYNGYDNLAYRRSESTVKNNQIFPWNVEADDSNSFHKFIDKRQIQLHVNNRMIGYSWPVTCFYIEKEIAKNHSTDKGEHRIIAGTDCSNSTDLRSKVSWVPKNCNLKRHCSLGYLEDEDTYQFVHKQRSLDKINRLSDTKSKSILPLSELDYKQSKLNKVQNSNMYAYALFAAIEHGCVEKVNTILRSSNVNVNSLNSDGLSPLDIAVLAGNKTLSKLLISYGAQEGLKTFSTDTMQNHLYQLLYEADIRLQELNGNCLGLNIESVSDLSSCRSSFGNIPTVHSRSSIQDRTSLIWERRAKGLKKMLKGFVEIRSPRQPSKVTVEITSATSILVRFTEAKEDDSPIVTKYKIQWSMDENFNLLWGHHELIDARQSQYHITNLRKGYSYYIRVACGNIKGFSNYTLSTPASIFLSSWRDLIKEKPCCAANIIDVLDKMYFSVSLNHPYLRSNYNPNLQRDMMLIHRRKKTAIRQLFTSSSKFQKHLRRGVYLSCMLYHEDKVLVTNEEFLPVLEVDENYPKHLINDFHWLFKIVFSWSDLKWLKNDMEKSQSSSTDFRIKLLQATINMQTALGILDLGQIYHQLIRDSEGTIVISLINHIEFPKSVSLLNLKWIPLAKLNKRTNMIKVLESNVGEILMSSITNQMTYHEVSNIKLPRGLYLSYLKLKSSVESLQVMVPRKTPNITPHYKIRDNPHVTAEEWEWLAKKENLRVTSPVTSQQRVFMNQVVFTIKRLFKHLDVPELEAINHRLYNKEVVEISDDVSLIMLIPPSNLFNDHKFHNSDLLPLSVQIFEMVHFNTYQTDFISKYAQLNNVIEMDIDLAQYHLRQAFSSQEVESAKSELSVVQKLHTRLNLAWKECRWLLDVITNTRERFSSFPSLHHILNGFSGHSRPENESQCIMQPSTSNYNEMLRERWPGISDDRNLSHMLNDIRRSQQNLVTEGSSRNLQGNSNDNQEKSGTNSCERAILASIVSNKLMLKQQRKGSLRSLHSLSSNNLSHYSDEKICYDECFRTSVPNSAIIKVYAGYKNSLACKPNFKFHVSTRTTAKEIVQLFVKQTNMLTLLRGKDGPIYSDEQIKNFCLVAVVGTREHRLMDDFKPIYLDRPWSWGRLYVCGLL